MSTNTNLPSIEYLTALANQFFAELPNSDTNFPASANSLPNYQSYLQPNNLPNELKGKEKLLSAQAKSPSLHSPIAGLGATPAALQQGSVQNVRHLHLERLDVITPSVAGSGASPSAIEQHNAVNIDDPQTSLRDPHFADGKIPKAVAGSGISPSAKNKENIFQPNGAKTPLPDPTYAGVGKTPPSVAGKGISPSIAQQHNIADNLPYSPTSSFENELTKALNEISQFSRFSQLPNFTNGLSEGAYYFLTDKNLAPYLKTAFSNEAVRAPFDINLVKNDFPILKEQVNGRQLVWLDNAATTQKPRQVIERIKFFYEHENSNIHRAAHELAARATDAYEEAREKIRQFLNAKSVNEIVFVRGTTEGINLVAQSWGEQYLREGDEIVLSHLEHHANIVPWQLLAAKKGLKLRVIPVDDDGQVILEEYAKLLNIRTRLVSFTHVSNALGTITPAKAIIDMAHQVGAKVLLDGAQSVSHIPIDVQALDPDWFVFSGHKVFAPTGIGALYGKEALLNETQPWQGGGHMIADVTFEHTVYNNAPTRFEAGTGNIADAVGLGTALDYITKLGMHNIELYEHSLLQYGIQKLSQVDGLRLIGTAREKASVLSFVLNGYTNDEVGQALNQEGIAVRTGHHCAQPILRRFGLESTVRPSLAFYNTCSDIDKLVDVLLRLRRKR